jgi:uncharacterized protein YndB with AHSA1/START domain
MIRGLARLAVAAAGAAWLADNALRSRRGDRPPEPLETLVVIDAPIDVTWRVLADVRRQPDWMADLKDIRLTTDGPVGVGTRAEGRVRILGIAIHDPVEVTAFEPPTRYAIRHAGSFQGSGTIELEPGVDGTTTIVRWTETLVPPVLPDLLATLQAPILRRVFQDDLFRLKDLVEAEHQAGSGAGNGAAADAGRDPLAAEIDALDAPAPA